MIVLILQLFYAVHQVDMRPLYVQIERVHFLETVDGLEMQIFFSRDTELVLCKVYIADTRIGLESLLILADP